jgi:hypothetical protein
MCVEGHEILKLLGIFIKKLQNIRVYIKDFLYINININNYILLVLIY